MTTVGVLLAAGQSRRFGAEDKLLTEFNGRPLVTHAGRTLAKAGCDYALAVTSNPAVTHALPGLRAVEISPGQPQSTSLRAGVEAAIDLGAGRLLVVLGDMPLVTTQTLNDVLARAAEHGLSATTDGSRRMPPISFERTRFPELLRLSGDRGARHILHQIPQHACVLVSKEELRDIDTPEDVKAMRRDTGQAEK
ncbi:MAG: nucleotidyltransferase family protein [Pseudomonadota bacterium]